MKVVQINGVSYKGSTGRIVSQLSETMNARGIENYIISSGYKEKKMQDNVIFISSYAGVRIHQILGAIFGDAGFHSFFSTRKMIALLKKIKPDIVHLHNIYSYYLNVTMLAEYLKKSNVETVWTIHDFWAITGHCTHYEAINCDRWRTRCHSCPQMNSYPYSKFFDRSTSLYTKKRSVFTTWEKLSLIAVSKWVRENIAYSYLSNKRIEIIPSGVDTKIFRPKKVDRGVDFNGKFLIISVAMTWSSKKGLDDLMEMSKDLADDECLILVGLSAEMNEDLPSKIIGLTRTTNADELADLYNLSDVCVSASTEETMGLTIVEAMACGTPAVVYNETALPDLIAEGCGEICEKGASNLYAAIQKVKAKGKAAFSDACINHVLAHYDKNTQYNRYCEYYKELLAIK